MCTKHDAPRQSQHRVMDALMGDAQGLVWGAVREGFLGEALVQEEPKGG